MIMTTDWRRQMEEEEEEKDRDDDVTRVKRRSSPLSFVLYSPRLHSLRLG
jgi:hypothetical protein